MARLQPLCLLRRQLIGHTGDLTMHQVLADNVKALLATGHDGVVITDKDEVCGQSRWGPGDAPGTP